MKNDVIVVLTTSNPEQDGLDNRLLQNMDLPYRVTTVCDNNCNKSIGSGGAFLQVLSRYYGKYKKIIVINSGGYSKRVINYSLKGKAFAHLNDNGKERTLLECIIENVCRITQYFQEGAIVCCSDILVQTENINISFNDNVGFCVPADLQTAARHGVMFEDKSGYLQHYLHKKSPMELRAFIEGAETVLLDTGMVYFCKETLESLYSFCQKTNLVEYLKNNAEQLCLYEDIVSIFSTQSEKNDYLEKACSSDLKILKSEMYDALKHFRLQVFTINREFIHFGTMRELIANIQLFSDSRHIFHSFLSKQSKCAGSAVLDNVCLSGACEVGENCFISDIALCDVKIEAGTSICGVKLKDGSFVCIVTSVFENPKDVINGQQIWELPRFYKAESFDSSYRDFLEQKSSIKLSIKECLENADYGFCTLLYDYIQTQIEQNRSGRYLEYRNRIISHHFQNLPQFDFSHYKKSRVQVNLPLRVNLAGTWTDAMPYCIDRGGKMLNMAVTCEGELPIQVCAERIKNQNIEFETNGKKETFKQGIQSELSDFNLFYAALKTIGLHQVNKLESGFRLCVTVYNIDRGSGLGVSSIVLAGCFMALDKLFALSLTPEQIVSFVFVAEQIMGTGGGWQDQVGALYPGLKISASCPGIEQKIHIQPLEPGENIKHLINNKSVLIPTGISHFGKSIVFDVMQRYLLNNEACLSGFEKIYRLNDAFIEAIESDNADAFCACVNLHSSILKSISHQTSTIQTEQMARALQPYVKALSLCGAGGGGYFYAVLRDEINREDFKNNFKTLFPSVGSAPKKMKLYY